MNSFYSLGLLLIFFCSISAEDKVVKDVKDAKLPLMEKPGTVLLSPSSIHKSHKIVMNALAEELVARGHKVIMWYIGMEHDGIPVPKGVEERFWKVQVPEKYIRNMLLYKNATVYNMIWDDSVVEPARKAAYWMMSLRMCELVLETRKAEFDKLVAEKFDTVVIDDLYNPCGLLHTSLQKSVFVYWSMTHMRTETAWSNQSPSPPSYIPVPGTGYTDEMGFWKRAFNMLSYMKTIYIHHRIVLRRLDAVFQRFYPGVPDAFFMERNASMNYINTPPIFDFSRPYMPRVAFVGGLHCKKAQALPEGKLNSFVAGVPDKEGFILITTGHAVQWQRAPNDIVRSFVTAFKQMPNTHFVWQYDGPAINDLPKNVHVAPWLPQQDLLGNKKCRAFVTAGGLNSVIEGIWHGKPIVGVPLFADFRDYLLRGTDRDAGFMLEKTFLSDKTLVKSFKKIMTEQKYKEGVAAFQDLLHDVPYTELQHATFWIEFIMRHKEIPQARSGADDLNIFQYFLVDVIAFLASVVFLIFATIWYAIKFSCRACCWTCKAAYRTATGKGKKKKTE
jgi:glucuronosyltransferase